MNSSTSNFRTEIKVIATILLVLIGCELILRKFETSLSFDLKHIRALPQLAENLAKSPGRRILFLGNSFVRATVNPNVFSAEMKSRGYNDLAVELAHPDGTRINEWYYTFKTYFVEPHRLPDLLVILTGRAHLQDQVMDPATMGAYYSSRSEVPDFLRTEALDIDAKVEFLLGRYSAAYANRRRIEPRIFSRIIPHYQACIQRINQERSRSSRRSKAVTYSRLEQLLQVGKDCGVPIVIATVPMYEPYSINPEIKELVATHKMQFIEAQNIDGIDSARFPDKYHIDEIGAEKYSRVLAGKFAELLESDPQFLPAR
jgi:hypothetical protein